MKKSKFKVPIYDWTVNVLSDVSEDELEEFEKVLKKLHTCPDDIEYLLDRIKNKHYNGGYLLTNVGQLNILLVFYDHKSEGAFINTMFHEVSHIVDYIAETMGLEGKEASGYLAGYVGEHVFKALTDEEKTKNKTKKKKKETH